MLQKLDYFIYYLLYIAFYLFSIIIRFYILLLCKELASVIINFTSMQRIKKSSLFNKQIFNFI